MPFQPSCKQPGSLTPQNITGTPAYGYPSPGQDYQSRAVTGHVQLENQPVDSGWFSRQQTKMEPQACTQRSYASAEQNYRGPRPSIPKFSHRDPGEFARLKMALDNLLPADGSELFKYQILVDHLQLEDAKLMADSYLNSPTPYSDTMAALNGRFGEPHQIALSRIASAMDSPDIRRGDTVAFDRFALQIRSLVGMLQPLGPEGEAELNCGSHVARLLSKLPQEKRADFRRAMFQKPGAIHTLLDFSQWLQYESWCQDVGGQVEFKTKKEGPQKKREIGRAHV